MTSVAEQRSSTAAGQDLAQRFGTDGIKPIARASFVTHLFMWVVAFVERLNLTCSTVGNPPIYDNAVFPWTKDVEREWRAIRAELDCVLLRQADLPGFHEISSEVATISQDRGW